MNIKCTVDCNLSDSAGGEYLELQVRLAMLESLIFNFFLKPQNDIRRQWTMVNYLVFRIRRGKRGLAEIGIS